MALNIYKHAAMKKYNETMKEFNPSYPNHNVKLFMNHCLVGKPGSGKTNQIINIILRLDRCFSKIQIYTANVDEPLYLMLLEKLNTKKNPDTVILENIKNIPRLSDQKTKKG